LSGCLLGGGECANVFGPIGEQWVSAAPRKATEDEIWKVTRDSLRRWFA